MLKHLLNQRASIFDEVTTTTDVYGSAIRSFVDTTGISWSCRVDPWKAQEFEVDRDTRKSFFRLMLSEKAAGHIDGHSRVQVDGVMYEVFGDPKVYRRRSRVSHVEAILRGIED